MSKDTLENKGLNPDLLAKAHSLMEWSNLLVIASGAIGIAAWFTSHFTLFYITSAICLLLSLLFLWGPVFIGIAEPGRGRIINGILFMVIGILITKKAIAGILLGGCFFGLMGMLPLAFQLAKDRKARKKQTEQEPERPGFLDKNRDSRVSQMSDAFNRLSEVTDVLVDHTPELEDLAPDVDLLKDYVSTGLWLEDFEADERGEIDPEVNRSVLSEDGLYNLMADLDSLMHCFERLTERFAADPELDKKIQELEQEL